MIYLVYFIVGILQDFLVTINIRFTSKDRIIPASITSFLVTVCGLLVLYNIIVKLNDERTFAAIVIYALGISFGTFLGMKFKMSK